MYSFTKEVINPEALKQTEIWYDAKGNLYQIKDLPFSYTRNIINLLYRKGHKMGAHSSPLMGALKAHKASFGKSV